MVSKIIICMCILVVSVTAVPPGGWGTGAQGANPWIPPWIAGAPWMPQWTECDATVPGPSCQDCSTRLVCTKVGGLLKPCTDPALPHCNLGSCSATPSTECAVPVVPGTLA